MHGEWPRRKGTVMRTLIVSACVLTLGGAGGFLYGGASHATSHSPHAAEPGELCGGGQEHPLAVELFASAVRSGPGGEVVEVDLQIANRFGRAAATAYSVEFVDDRGNPVLAPRRSGRIPLAQAHGRHAAVLSTPAALRDGYYQMRVTVAGLAGEEESAQYKHLYFRVEQGRITPIEYEEWVTRSRATQEI
jgi:hypothetical protein